MNKQTEERFCQITIIINVKYLYLQIGTSVYCFWVVKEDCIIFVLQERLLVFFQNQNQQV